MRGGFITFTKHIKYLGSTSRTLSDTITTSTQILQQEMHQQELLINNGHTTSLTIAASTPSSLPSPPTYSCLDVISGHSTHPLSTNLRPSYTAVSTHLGNKNVSGEGTTHQKWKSRKDIYWYNQHQKPDQITATNPHLAKLFEILMNNSSPSFLPCGSTIRDDVEAQLI